MKRYLVGDLSINVDEQLVSWFEREIVQEIKHDGLSKDQAIMVVVKKISERHGKNR